jgi:anti-sigma regulatory factor (Ser/Thr protein kinase)
MPLGDETERLRVGIALGEAINNAYYHGNMEVSTEASFRDRKSYESLARQRSIESPYCDRKIHVRVRISRTEARFVIRDEGSGFEVSQFQLSDPSLPTEQSYGRGIVLMRSIMDEVSYNATGNEVTLVKWCVSMDDTDEE